MSYQTITQYNSPNYTPKANVLAVYGLPRTIIGITIHHWGDPATNPTFEGVVAWLCNPRSQVSCHPVVTGTGKRSAWLVDAVNAAWHGGNSKANAQTIGIECDPRCRDEDYDTVAEQVADIWIAYGKLPLYPHKYWKSTACPGNYDLNRIQREAEAWYNRKTNPQPPADNRPEWLKNLKKWSTPKTLYAIDGTTPLRNLASPATVIENYAKGTPFEIAGETKVNGFVYYLTKFSIDNNKGNGFDIYELQDTDPNAVVTPEWIRNLKDIEDLKLSVLPANGTPVVNLTTLAELPNSIIPKGTSVDIAKETTVAGKRYYITNYSVQHNISNGVLADDLGVPANPPAEEKPEWLKNLKDIEDKDFWTRSETPVLDPANGNVLRVLPINQKVRVTHSTTIIDKPLLVLEGSKEVIETVYLSDTPIPEPNKDLDQKNNNLLKQILKILLDIVSKLTSIFK